MVCHIPFKKNGSYEALEARNPAKERTYATLWCAIYLPPPDNRMGYKVSLYEGPFIQNKINNYLVPVTTIILTLESTNPPDLVQCERCGHRVGIPLTRLTP